MGNLALSYGQLGLNQRTLELGQHVLDIPQRAMGSEDHNALKTMGSLADACRTVGQGALELSQRAWGIRKRECSRLNILTQYALDC